MRVASDINLPRGPGLTASQLEKLVIRARAGDLTAREEVVRRNLRLVMSVVGRFGHRSAEREDLFQIGCLGLMKAVDRFEPERGFCFSTFAVPMIFGEIQSFLRDDHPVRVSRSLKATAMDIYRVREQLANEIGREPTLAEVAGRAGMSQDAVVEALDAVSPPVSLQDVVFEEDGQGVERASHLAAGGDESAAAVEMIALRQALAALPERERSIIELRFFGEKTQCEVARAFGLSQVQISRLERRALTRLRDFFD